MAAKKKTRSQKARFHRCVEHVRGKVRNPYAVCHAAGAGKPGKKKSPG